MSALADFYDLLIPELSGCSTAMLDLHLRDVTREFCGATSVWRAPLASIDTVADQATYTVVVPVNSQLVRITKLAVAGLLLWQLSDRGSDRSALVARPKYAPSNPPFSMDEGLSQITLMEVPEATVIGGMEITAALKPSLDASTVPDFLRTQHSEAIRFGVLSRLMAMGKKPWTDRELASAYASRWNSALAFAAYQAQVGNTREPLRVKKHH